MCHFPKTSACPLPLLNDHRLRKKNCHKRFVGELTTIMLLVDSSCYQNPTDCISVTVAIMEKSACILPNK